MGNRTLGIAAVVLALAAAVAVVLLSLDGGGPRVTPLPEAARSASDDQGATARRPTPPIVDPASRAPQGTGRKVQRRKATGEPRRARRRQASGGASLTPVRAQSRPKRSRKGARKRVKVPATVPAAPSTGPAAVVAPGEQGPPAPHDDAYPISLDPQPVDPPPDAIEVKNGDLVDAPLPAVYKRGQRVRLRVRSDEDDRGRLIEFDAPADGLYELRRQGRGFVFTLLGGHP